MADTTFVDGTTRVQASWLNDVNDATYNGTATFTPSGTGAVAGTVQAKLRESLSAFDFMTTAQIADVQAGTTLLDVTTALQAALDACKLGAKKLFLPAGRYLISQIQIPGGIEFYGVAIGHYGNSATNDTTVLVQKDGVNKDAVVFDAAFDGTYYRIDPGYIHDLTIKKVNSPADTTGNGISFQDGSGNHAMANGEFIIQRVQIRGFPENGIYCKQGGTPIYFDTIDVLFCGGYGIRFDGEQNSANIVFKDIAGDGNKGGAAIRYGTLVSNSNVFIYNIYGEYRNDNPYGNTTGFSAAQPWAIEINNCATNGTVMIHGINGNSAYSTEAIDAAIYLNLADATKAPFITWDGISIKRAGYASGNAYALKDAINSINLPYECTSGCYSNKRYFGINIASGRWGFGTGAPSAIAHSHVNTLSASRANANWYGTRDHTSGYFSVQFLTGASVADWFEYSDSSSTSIGSETNKPLDIYTNNSAKWRYETAGHHRPLSDNVYDIGTSSVRPRNIYAGSLRVIEGSNCKQGTATLVAGTVTVSNTSVTANSRILLTVQSLGTVAAPKAIAVTARSAGTSFTITSEDATDTSVVAYQIFEPG